MRKKHGVVLLITSLLIASLSGYYLIEQQYSRQTGLIRLHVIANSNTFYDQNLKYQVKDCVVKEMAPIFGQAEHIGEARQIADDNLETIRRTAENEIKSRGYDYQVQVIRGDYYFPAKRYTVQNKESVSSLTLPPGRYEAVRIIIGEGKGANWWCVLYPPLCFVDYQQAAPPMQLTPTLKTEDLPTAASEKEVKPKIEYRFKILEWFGR